MHLKALQKSKEARKQLLGIMKQQNLEVISCGQSTTLVQQAVVSAFSGNLARKEKRGRYVYYRTLKDDQMVSIHPSSALFQRKPELVVFHEVMRTKNTYMMITTTAESKWLKDSASYNKIVRGLW